MIREYIAQHLINKLKASPSLVVYDPDLQYEEVVEALAQKVKVFDVRESALTVREDAYDYFNKVLPQDPKAGMIVYVPFPVPMDDQQKIEDPFFIFTQGNNCFPYSTSDKYEALCKACFPDKEQQINELFMNAIPDFDTIDALGEGTTYAKLQTITGGKSEKEILHDLMVPSESQLAKLTKDKTWLGEWKKLAALIGLVTNAKKYEDVREELWRFMLFSEFVFDLPIDLPQKLKTTPVAKASSKNLVLELVRSIRNNKACEEIYIEKAEAIEKQLDLRREFEGETNLGEIATFAFEDNTYFNHFFQMLKSGDTSKAQAIIQKNKENIWPRHDEERRKLWQLAEFATEIISRTSDGNKTFKTVQDLVQAYTKEFYLIDQYHRKYEMHYNQLLLENETAVELTNLTRNAYRAFADKLQKKFQEHIVSTGWPIEGIQKNIQIFDKRIYPALKSKKKTAYILVDALRYELGKELEESLRQYFKIEVDASCAFMPSVTKYGMSALLPEADKKLSLRLHADKLEAFMEDTPLLNLSDRKNWIKQKLGDRCNIISLDQLIGNNEVKKADLLIITSNEIDAAGENLSNNALNAMQHAMQHLSRGILKLKTLGYEHIIIATDHGFMLYPNFQPGDNVSKPQGNWKMIKTRSLAGSGHIPDYALGFSPSQLGIQSEVEQFLFLKNFAVFERNTQYFHEGLSLQENIVPILVITVPKGKQEQRLEITLTYRGKSEGTITTRRPLIDLSSYLEGSLGLEAVSVKLEALAGETVVGEPITSEAINDMTKLAEIYPSQVYKIPFAMKEDFEGKFEVRASDPLTGKTFASIFLSTDYLD